MWGAESSRAGSPPPRYVPVRRRTPVGGFDGRGSSSPMQGGAVVGGPGGKTKGSSVSSGVRGGGAALAAMGSNRQFSPGSGDFISRAPPPSPTFGAPVATVAGAPSQRSARTKSLNCARETVYEKTLRILMTADQNPARWRTEDSAGGDCGGSANGDGGTFSAFAREVGDDSRSKDGDVDLLPPQSNTLLSYFKRAPAATDTAMEVEDL